MALEKHLWFAWFPVVADGKLIWLTRVWRHWDWRLNNWCDMSGYSGSDGGWVYEEIQ